MSRSPSLVTVGLDLGGTASRFVALDQDGAILESLTRSTPTGPRPSAALDFLADGISQVSAGGELVAMGIGASGPIDLDGIIRNPETLPGFSGVDLLGALEGRFGVRPTIDNDAVTAAIYETTLGVAAGYHSALVVTIGTGVGVAVIVGGAPVRGADGIHPESGHHSIFGPAARCYCGRESCWEQLASRQALQARCEALIGGSATGTEAIRDTIRRARGGDVEAAELFCSFGGHLAQGIANLLTVYRTECVVLGGSGAQFFEAYQSGFTAHLGSVVDCFPQPRIEVSANTDTAGAIGAALWARHAAP